jgi:transcriptional regulator with XRE-family HTH domain
VDFATRFRSAREAAGFTQAELARLSGLTRAVISKWEKGDGAQPSAHALAQAAFYFDDSVSIEELLTGRKRPKIKRSPRRKPTSRISDLMSSRLIFLEDVLKRHRDDYAPDDIDALKIQLQKLLQLIDAKPTPAGKKKATKSK